MLIKDSGFVFACWLALSLMSRLSFCSNRISVKQISAYLQPANFPLLSYGSSNSHPSNALLCLENEFTVTGSIGVPKLDIHDC